MIGRVAKDRGGGVEVSQQWDELIAGMPLPIEPRDQCGRIGLMAWSVAAVTAPVEREAEGSATGLGDGAEAGAAQWNATV